MVSLLMVRMWIWRASPWPRLISVDYLLMRWVRILMPLVISLACFLGFFFFFFFNLMCWYRLFGVLRRVLLLLWTQTWRWLPLSSLELLNPSRGWLESALPGGGGTLPVGGWGCFTGSDGPFGVYACSPFHDGCGIPIVEEWHPLYPVGFRWEGLRRVQWHSPHAFPYSCGMCSPFSFISFFPSHYFA